MANYQLADLSVFAKPDELSKYWLEAKNGGANQQQLNQIRDYANYLRGKAPQQRGPLPGVGGAPGAPAAGQAAATGAGATPAGAQAANLTVPNGYVALGKQQGVSWQPNGQGGGQVLYNGNQVNTAGLQNIGGHWYGTPEAINGALGVQPDMQPVDQRQQMIDSVNQMLSPEQYQALFAATMQQLMPTYDAAKADAEVDLQRTNEATNADLERRGFYNSGAGATMMQRNRESMDRGLAGQLADLRRQAVSATNDAMARQLQAAGLLGDWYQSDRGFNQVSATDQAKLTLDKDLGERGLDIQQQNANTNKFSAESQDYGMREGLKLDEAKFQESIKQFWAQIGEQQADRAARSSQFWAGLGLDERKLSLAEKSQALEATIQQGELELAQNKQLSEDKLIKRGQAMEDMRTKSDAYGYVDALLQKANDPNTKNKPTKDSIMKMIKPYDDKEVFGDLYGELKSSVDGAFKAPAATSSSYTNPKITTGRGALTDAVANAGANWWNNLWGK